MIRNKHNQVLLVFFSYHFNTQHMSLSSEIIVKVSNGFKICQAEQNIGTEANQLK